MGSAFPFLAMGNIRFVIIPVPLSRTDGAVNTEIVSVGGWVCVRIRYVHTAVYVFVHFISAVLYLYVVCNLTRAALFFLHSRRGYIIDVNFYRALKNKLVGYKFVGKVFRKVAGVLLLVAAVCNIRLFGSCTEPLFIMQKTEGPPLNRAGYFFFQRQKTPNWNTLLIGSDRL